MTVTSNIFIGLPAWLRNHAYSPVGFRMRNGTRAYQLTTAGTSLNVAGGPVGTGTAVSDGTCVWKYLGVINYSTLASWVASIPTPLTQPIVGLLWNCGTITGTLNTVFLSLTGHVTTATNTITLGCAPGESFRDNLHSNPGTALAFNATNGVSFTLPSGTSTTLPAYFDIADSNVILDGLQFKDPFSNSQCCIIYIESGSVTTIRNCIVDGYSQSLNGGQMFYLYGTMSLYNNLIIDRGSANGGPTIHSTSGYSTFTNNTFISTAGQNNALDVTSALALNNCYFGGYSLSITAVTTGTVATSFCAFSDATLPVACANNGNNIVSAASTNQFIASAIPYITPGNGIFSDAAGNTYTITAGNDFLENNAQLPADVGAGTAAAEFYNNLVYAQDIGGQWYTWDQAYFTAVAAPPTPSSVPDNFRLKAGAPLVNAGSISTTAIPSADDIILTLRPQGPTWDIGAVELISANTTNGRNSFFSLRSIVAVANSYVPVFSSLKLNTDPPLTEQLLYWNHSVYAQDSVNLWWLWNGTTFSSSIDPRGVPATPTVATPFIPISVASNQIAVNLLQYSGAIVPATLFGFASGGLLSNNTGNFIIASDPNFQTAMTSRNYSIPALRLYFGDYIDQTFSSKIATANWTKFDAYLNSLNKWSRGQMLATINFPTWFAPTASTPSAVASDQTAYAQQVVQVAQHFANAGYPIYMWEMMNEQDSMDINLACNVFNALASALRTYDNRNKVGGLTDNSYRSARIHTFLQQCTPDFICFHQYSYGDNLSLEQGNSNQAALTQIVQWDGNKGARTDSGSTLPFIIGETNIDGYWYRQQDNGPADFFAGGIMTTWFNAVYMAAYMWSVINANSNTTMINFWDLVGNADYGAFDGAYTPRPVSYFFQQANRSMVGAQISSGVDPALNLKVYAIANGNSHGIQIVNFDTVNSYTIRLTGLEATGTYNYWLLDINHVNGLTQTNQPVSQLTALNCPPASVIILSGTH